MSSNANALPYLQRVVRSYCNAIQYGNDYIFQVSTSLCCCAWDLGGGGRGRHFAVQNAWKRGTPVLLLCKRSLKDVPTQTDYRTLTHAQNHSDAHTPIRRSRGC